MADKKRDILEFFEQSNFEQFTPTQFYFNLLWKFNNYFRAKNKYPIDHNQYKFITDILIFVVLKFLFPDEINNSFALIRRSGEWQRL